MMHRLLIPLAMILAATNLFGQTEAQGPNPTQKPKPEGNCAVSGRVISATDGAPLRSARVGLVQRDVRQRPQIYGATADSDGHFEIKQIVAG
ncbi:MAG TPA: carboxypeptidase-like regulatory domain-containing protein, partial [Terriglobales bacterium]